VEKLGGKILVPKMAVPKMGYFALCMDTESNVFGLWENDPQAK
jgi:predicted enzyme related to lactoylglutathione lyase